MTYGSEKKTPREYVMIGLLIFAGIALFLALSQPVWNAKALIKEQTEDCKKVGGVEIVDHHRFSDEYSCQARLDRGVSQ